MGIDGHSDDHQFLKGLVNSTLRPTQKKKKKKEKGHKARTIV
jgi:hypothetical protein